MSFPTDTADRIMLLTGAPISLELIALIQGQLDFISSTRPTLEFSILDLLDEIGRLSAQAATEGSQGNVKRVEDIEFYDKKEAAVSSAKIVASKTHMLLRLLGLTDSLSHLGVGRRRNYQG